MRRGFAVLLLLLAVPASAAAAARAGAKPRVTLITDSVGGALGWDPAAARIFENGFDARLELASCRRLTTLGCSAGGVAPENALELIRRLGPGLGPNVVIDVGYNDYPTVYAPGIERILEALRAARVEHVFWVKLRASSRPYMESNAAIDAAARRHRDVSVIDWNACSSGHPDWFGPDGVHLTAAGAQGLARCLHDGVAAGLKALPPPLGVDLSLEDGLWPGFRAHLRGTGGRAPYRFLVSGLPPGLRATPAGRVIGTFPRRGDYRLRIRIRDALGRTATQLVTLTVS